MRLGISGSHATGKSTLAAELRAKLPDYRFVEEPYYQLLEEGHEFGARLTTDDIALQLRHSIDLVEATAGRDIVFDRCPVDFLAYLVVLRAEPDSVQYWFRESQKAMASLDAVIFVPVEQPDRITTGVSDLPKLRRAVDRRLREGLLEGAWGFSVTTRECYGICGRARRTSPQVDWLARESRPIAAGVAIRTFVRPNVSVEAGRFAVQV